MVVEFARFRTWTVPISNEVRRDEDEKGKPDDSRNQKPETTAAPEPAENARCSNSAHDQKHDNNQEDQPHASCRIIAPASAMRPSWQSAKERQHQNYNQDCSKHVSLLVFLHADKIIRPAALSLSRPHKLRCYIDTLIAIPTLGYLRL